MNEYQDIQDSEPPGTNQQPDVGGSSSGSLSLPSISRRQAFLGVTVVVLVALVVWQLRQRSEQVAWEDEDRAAVEQVEDYDFEANRLAEDAAEEIRVPSDPENELDKDAAVLDGLRRAGVMGGGEA